MNSHNFAVIETGGKQYKVAKNSVINIEKINAEPGSTVMFDKVLMVGEDSKPVVIGTPVIKGVSVTGQVVTHGRSSKIIVFKKKRRQNYRRKHGHMQDATSVKILEIVRN